MDHKLAISSISMGWHTSHTLESKISAAKAFGISGMEMFNDDLDKFAQFHQISRLEAASRIGQLFKDAQVTVVCYGSFDNFEGQATPLASRLETASEWCEIAHRLNTPIIQVPSNWDAKAVGEYATIIPELQALADLGNKQTPPISFAYEALAWGTHVADWEESLNIVQLVNRANFGLCLDTYHVLARLWADPAAHSGRRPGGDVALRDSLQRFRDSCPPEKIIYIQLSDAELADPPILPGHPAYHRDKNSTHSWCSWGRIMPFEREYGAYLPMKDILLTWLVESKWSGWVSMEVFHRSMDDERATPETWAKRARDSWETIQSLIKQSPVST